MLLLSSLIADPTLRIIDSLNVDLRLSSLLAAACLFGPASLLIGFISPHLAKVRVTSLRTTGVSIGRLEAAGALGSIFGTFVSGYVLLGYFGSRDIGVALAVILFLTSFIVMQKRYLWQRLALILLALMVLLTPRTQANVLLDTDSAFARYQVVRGVRDGRSVHYLLTDGQSTQSGVYPEQPDDIVLNYSRQIASFLQSLDKRPENLLTIGGAVHSIPRQLAYSLNLKESVSVEVDPALDQIARDYFSHDGEQVRAVYQDGRAYLRDSDERFDAIILDAFSATTPPFHLTTGEAMKALKDHLNEDGVLLTNVISNYPDGMLPHMVATQSAVYEKVLAFRINDEITSGKQNFIVAAGTNSVVDEIQNQFSDRVIDVGLGFVLTDDFAPVERLTY